MQLKGTVKDASGNPVPGAGVYVSNSKKATVTNSDGHFTFSSMDPGTYDILVQMIGFNPKQAHVSLLEKNEEVQIVLTESLINISEVVIKPDPDRPHYMALFRNYFIGKSPNSLLCKILNPEVIRFNYDRKSKVLTATADDFIIIENKALGYRIKYLLQGFSSDATTHIVYYEGYPNFEELAGTNRMKRKWEAARRIAFLGSQHHFYRSLATGSATEEGFIIHKVSNIANKARPDDRVIENNIRRLMPAGPPVTIKAGDSLSYWMKMKREPKTLAILNQAIVNPDTLVHSVNENLKYLNFSDELFVIYTKEKEPDNFLETGYRLARPMTLTEGQVSQIKPLRLPIGFYNSGSIADPTSTLSSGFFAYEKVADQLPLEYTLKK